MLLRHLESKHQALMACDLFIDFLIDLINTDRVEITKNFYIWLVKPVNPREIEKEIVIHFDWSGIRGPELTPVIQRFRLEIVNGVVSRGVLISEDPESYDRMLELLKACLRYVERNDPEKYVRISRDLNLEALNRDTWKKSKSSIEDELDRNTDLRIASEDFRRMRNQKRDELISRYRSQGYEITE